MSLWLDMLGTEVRLVTTQHFGKIRIAEAGKEHAETILFMHGINGHLEAYAKNLIPLSKHFHVIAFDFVGHGESSKLDIDYTPVVLANQLGELMDALGLKKAHLSGESLGGWVAALFAVSHPERVGRMMLNTAGGLPVVSAKGKADLKNLIDLNRQNINNTPTYESVQARMHWLMHEKNKHLVDDELVSLRLGFYLRPETRVVAPKITRIIENHDDFLIPVNKIRGETLFLWTLDNPIHDLETARAAAARVPGSQLYVMKGDSAHWPQFELPEEFNDVTVQFFKTGQVAGSETFAATAAA